MIKVKFSEFECNQPIAKAYPEAKAKTINSGTVHIKAMGFPQEFSQYLNSQNGKFNNAICLGSPSNGIESQQFATKKDVDNGLNAIARTMDHFAFHHKDEHGLLLIDYDQGEKTPEQVIHELVTIEPIFSGKAYVVSFSSNSHIYQEEQQIKSSGKFHIYFSFKGDIRPFFGQLKHKVHAAGFTCYEYSSDGKKLTRNSVFDELVCSPERVIYESGAMCYPPYSQRRPASYFVEGDAIEFISNDNILPLQMAPPAQASKKWSDEYFDPNMLEEYAKELISNGYHLIPLHKFGDNGVCSCGQEKCTRSPKNAGKHPKMLSWQDSKPMDETTLDHLMEYYEPHGLGIVLNETQLVVDVDCGPGKEGLKSLYLLEQDIGIKLASICKFSVKSGSGNGSMHFHFSKPESIDIRNKLPKIYPDIDFLSKGAFVVAPGSLHLSGDTYDLEDGQFSKIGKAPDALLAKIKKDVSFIDEMSKEPGTASEDEIDSALNHIMNEAHKKYAKKDVPYSQWFEILLAIHYEYRGSDEGFKKFLDFCKKGGQYDGPEAVYSKWQEGFKFSDPSKAKITIATLYHIAHEYGWEGLETNISINFDKFFEDIAKEKEAGNIQEVVIKSELSGGELKGSYTATEIPKEVKDIPGILGVIAKYAQDSSPKKSFLVSLVAAIQTVGALCGRDFRTNKNNFTNNYFMIIGDSGCGKDTAKSLPKRIMVDIANSIPGVDYERRVCSTKATSAAGFFSSLQMSPRKLFSWDEIGHMFNSAKKSGQGKEIEVISKIIELYSEASNEYMLQEYSKIGLKEEDRERDTPTIQRPCVSFTGISTPVQMESALDKKFMEDGTINRFMIVLPQEKHIIYDPPEPQPVPKEIKVWYDKVLTRLANHAKVGSKSSLNRSDPENPMEPVVIPFSEEAWRYIYQYQHELKPLWDETAKKGYYKIMERLWEQSLKLSLTVQLAIDPMATEISMEAVKYAKELTHYLKKEEIKYYDVYYAENKFESIKNKVAKIVSDTGQDGIKQRDLLAMRPLKGMKPKDQREILLSLMSSRIIIEARASEVEVEGKEKRRGAPPKKIFFVDHVRDQVQHLLDQMDEVENG